MAHMKPKCTNHRPNPDKAEYTAQGVRVFWCIHCDCRIVETEDATVGK